LVIPDGLLEELEGIALVHGADSTVGSLLGRKLILTALAEVPGEEALVGLMPLAVAGVREILLLLLKVQSSPSLWATQ
jgi:hypothetical protein